MFDPSDFTEEAYRGLLIAARARWSFLSYPGALEGNVGCLWRHDIDFSPHRALRLATIEAEESVRATYFVLLHSDFYNALESRVATLIRRIAALGHDIGIHVDAGAYGGRIDSVDGLATVLAFEKRIIEDFLETPVASFSFHNPTVHPEAFTDAPLVAGLVNAYGRSIQDRFDYVSDSNGYWRHRRLADFIAQTARASAHILTHPEWWTPTPMSPRDRVTRCIDGRARRQHEEYDRFLEQHGRLNVR